MNPSQNQIIDSAKYVRLYQAEEQLGATKRELLGLSDGTAPAYEGQPDWNAIDKRRNYLINAFPQEQIEVNRLSEQLRDREVYARSLCII